MRLSGWTLIFPSQKSHSDRLLGENDAVWRLSTRRHSPLHNNEPELIDYFTSPLGIRESICSAGVEFKRGRPSSSHLRKQMPFALHVAANEYSCYGKRKRKKKEG